MSKDKEPVEIRLQRLGGQFYEQVQTNSGMKYAHYDLDDAFKLVDEVVIEATSEYVKKHVPVVMDNPPFMPPLFPCTPPDPELWGNVRQYITDLVWLQDSREYDLLTAWVFASWIPEVSRYAPYLFLHGVPDSGKTRVLEVLQVLCRRAVLIPSITPATIYRINEMWGACLLLDETEIYNAKDRGEVYHILNSGYKRGQQIPRCKPDSNEIEWHDPFGWKAMASTQGMKFTTETRCFIIYMEKGQPKNFEIDYARGLELKTQLLWWRMRRMRDFREVAKSDVLTFVTFFQSEKAPELAFANGRFAELYQPLIAVANDGLESIIDYAREKYEETKDIDQTSNEALVVQTILKIASMIQNGFMATASIAYHYQQGREVEDGLNNKQIGWIMKRLGFKPMRTNAQRGWRYDADRVERLKLRYGILEADSPEINVTNDTTSLNFYEERRQERFSQLTRDGVKR